MIRSVLTPFAKLDLFVQLDYSQHVLIAPLTDPRMIFPNCSYCYLLLDPCSVASHSCAELGEFVIGEIVANPVTEADRYLQDA